MNITKHEIPNDIHLVNAGETLTQACHGNAHNNGWWHDLETGKKVMRPIPECLMLIVTEVAEAMEGHRKDLMDDHLVDRKMIEVELADAVIRIFDLAGGYDLDVAGAIADKMAYNNNRADHKVENRAKEGGKKI